MESIHGQGNSANWLEQMASGFAHALPYHSSMKWDKANTLTGRFIYCD
jgi:hypothetical protein